MVWVKLSDAIPLERRVRALSDRAFRFWMSALCYTNRELSDGKIPADDLPMVQPGRDHGELLAAVSELIKSGVLEASDDGGWWVVWGLDDQPTKEDVDARRRQDAIRKAKQRGNMSRRDSAADSRRESRSPVPSRPVPSRPDPVQIREDAGHGGDSQEPDEPDSDPEPLDAPIPPLANVSDLAAALDGLGGATVSPRDLARLRRVVPLLDALAASRGVPRADVLTAARDAFRADCASKGKRHLGTAVLLAQLQVWTSVVSTTKPTVDYLPPPPDWYQP